MFDASVINYLQSKNIECSSELRAKYGLNVYAELVKSILPIDKVLLNQTKYVLTAEQYFIYKEAGYIK